MKTTVLYFSPTGGTEKVAQMIAGELKADALDITTFGYDLSYDADELLFSAFRSTAAGYPARFISAWTACAATERRPSWSRCTATAPWTTPLSR